MPSEASAYVQQVEFNRVLGGAVEALNELKRVLIEHAAENLVENAAEFAPDEADFSKAIMIEGPEGSPALWKVQDEFAERLDDYPTAVDAMRSSIEWDDGYDGSDEAKAAIAIVNESLEMGAKLWAERSPEKAPGAR